MICSQSRPWLPSVMIWTGRAFLGSKCCESKERTSRPLPSKVPLFERIAGATGAKRTKLRDLGMWKAQRFFLWHKRDILKIH